MSDHSRSRSTESSGEEDLEIQNQFQIFVTQVKNTFSNQVADCQAEMDVLKKTIRELNTKLSLSKKSKPEGRVIVDKNKDIKELDDFMTRLYTNFDSVIDVEAKKMKDEMKKTQTSVKKLFTKTNQRTDKIKVLMEEICEMKKTYEKEVKELKERIQKMKENHEKELKEKIEEMKENHAKIQEMKKKRTLDLEGKIREMKETHEKELETKTKALLMMKQTHEKELENNTKALLMMKQTYEKELTGKIREMEENNARTLEEKNKEIEIKINRIEQLEKNNTQNESVQLMEESNSIINLEDVDDDADTEAEVLEEATENDESVLAVMNVQENDETNEEEEDDNDEDLYNLIYHQIPQTTVLEKKRKNEKEDRKVEVENKKKRKVLKNEDLVVAGCSNDETRQRHNPRRTQRPNNRRSRNNSRNSSRSSTRNDYTGFKTKVETVEGEEVNGLQNGNGHKYKCNLCGAYQRFSSGMNYHIRQEHPEVAEQIMA